MLNNVDEIGTVILFVWYYRHCTLGFLEIELTDAILRPDLVEALNILFQGTFCM